MKIPKPQLDSKILERLDNAIAVCDAPFVMHDGFAHFALTYFTRPYTTFMLIPSGVLDDVTSITCNGGGVALPRNVVARMVFEILLKNDYAELNGMFAGEQLSMHGQITRIRWPTMKLTASRCVIALKLNAPQSFRCH